MREERLRMFAPKSYGVDITGCQAVALHLLGIEWIDAVEKSLLDSFDEPVSEKCGYVCSSAGANYQILPVWQIDVPPQQQAHSEDD